MEQGEARNSLTQLRRGVVEYCVLALLVKEELYGFDLVRRLADIDGLVTSEGTIYPLLSRLRRDGSVSTRWRESESGPPAATTRSPRPGVAGWTPSQPTGASFGARSTGCYWRATDGRDDESSGRGLPAPARAGDSRAPGRPA